ncbi:MAG: PspC domain-containing protein [Sphingomonadales bacterium]|nr:PspC domain-containing protein [Sphingomonadales bacterium]
MKKIITINLSGRILSIEEPAFEQLQSYIARLRDFFATEESREEIISDMQGRIAELMHEKIKKGTACITELDVQELIALMGRPEELAQEGASDTTMSGASANAKASEKENASYTEGAAHRKLYRDQTNSVIGGVAGGLAAYLGIDPAIVRALLVILAFSSFGLALFGYVLMWIFLPASTVETFKGKRFYRDPENKVLGGVAGGLAAYFDKPVKNIRLLFLSPLLLQILFSILDWTDDDFTIVLFNLSFGSLVGFSIIVYITLWVILPKAVTPYQKMEMRGEKIDLASIQKQVKQGADQLKEKVSNWGKEVETVANELPGKAEKFASEVTQRVQEKFSDKDRTIGSRLFKAIGLLIKVFFAFFFGILAFSLLVALLAICFAGAVTWPYQSFLWANNSQQLMAWAALLLFVVVPLLGFIIWLVRRIVGYKQKSAVLRYSFFSLWTLGWVMMFLLFSSLGKEFSAREQVVTPVPLTVANPSSLHLTVSQPALHYSNRVPWIHIQGEETGWDLTKDTLKLSAVIIETIESRDSHYHIEMLRIATGRNSQQAIARAETIHYPVNTQGYASRRSNTVDTVTLVDLPSFYAIAANNKYRGQQVKIVVQVPVGKTISFDESIKEKLTQGELHIGYNKRGRVKEFSWEDADFPYQSGTLYKMMPGGILRPVEDSLSADTL